MDGQRDGVLVQKTRNLKRPAHEAEVDLAHGAWRRALNQHVVGRRAGAGSPGDRVPADRRGTIEQQILALHGEKRAAAAVEP
jgi:hypothetical protein